MKLVDRLTQTKETVTAITELVAGLKPNGRVVLTAIDPYLNRKKQVHIKTEGGLGEALLLINVLGEALGEGDYGTIETLNERGQKIDGKDELIMAKGFGGRISIG